MFKYSTNPKNQPISLMKNLKETTKVARIWDLMRLESFWYSVFYEKHNEKKEKLKLKFFIFKQTFYQ